MSKLADGRLGRCHRFRDLCRGKDVMDTAALDPSSGFRGPTMRRAARSAALPDPSRVSGVQRVQPVGIDTVKSARHAHTLPPTLSSLLHPSYPCLCLVVA